MNNGNAPSLTGKTAVVTGASSGIGRAIAERLGSAGAHVYLAGRTTSAMDASKAIIEANGGHATPVVTDVRDTAQVQALVERAAEETGRLDIMVNNAGVSHPSTIIDADPAEWREMFETNVIALLAGCQAPSVPCGRPVRRVISSTSPVSPPGAPTRASTVPPSTP